MEILDFRIKPNVQPNARPALPFSDSGGTGEGRASSTLRTTTEAVGALELVEIIINQWMLTWEEEIIVRMGGRGEDKRGGEGVQYVVRGSTAAEDTGVRMVEGRGSMAVRTVGGEKEYACCGMVGGTVWSECSGGWDRRYGGRRREYGGGEGGYDVISLQQRRGKWWHKNLK